MADDSKLHAHRAETSDGGIAMAERPPQDPLAELARLIGQDDLFEKMRRDAARAGQDPAAPSDLDEIAAASESQVPEQSVHAELRGSYDPTPYTASAHEIYPEPTHSQSTYPEQVYAESEPPTYTPAPRRYAEPARQVESERYEEADARYQPTYSAPTYAAPAYAAPAYAAPAYAAPAGHTDPYYADGPAAAHAYDPAQDYGDPAYAEEPPPAPRRRSGFKTIAAILGLAVVGTAGAYGYRSMAGSGTTGQPPVIAGPSTPLKVAATGSGKEQGSQTTYDRPDRRQPERMVPREEQPLEPPRASTTRPLTTGSAPGLPGVPGVPNQQLAALPGSAGAANALTGQAEPKKVKTIPIRPDLSVAPESAAARQSGTGRPPARPASQPPTAAAPAQATDPLRAANSAPMRTASIPTATAAAGSHVVQVASQKTEEDAQATFRVLQGKYPSVLAGRQPLIRKTDLGDRGTFYRVQVGPFGSSDAANGLCENLKAAGGQCIVQRN